MNRELYTKVQVENTEKKRFDTNWSITEYGKAVLNQGKEFIYNEFDFKQIKEDKLIPETWITITGIDNIHKRHIYFMEHLGWEYIKSKRGKNGPIYHEFVLAPYPIGETRKG